MQTFYRHVTKNEAKLHMQNNFTHFSFHNLWLYPFSILRADPSLTELIVTEHSECHNLSKVADKSGSAEP